MLGKDAYTLWLQKLISKEHWTLKHLKHLIVTPANCHFSFMGHRFQIWSWEQRCGQGCAFQFACLVRLLSLLYGYHYVIVAVTTLRSMRSVKSLTMVENWTEVHCIIALAMGSSRDEAKIQIPISFLYKCQALACTDSNFKTETTTRNLRAQDGTLESFWQIPSGAQGGLSRWWLRLCGSGDLYI